MTRQQRKAIARFFGKPLSGRQAKKLERSMRRIPEGQIVLQGKSFRAVPK